VMEMMETRVKKEKPPVVYDLDDYRRGLRDRPNDAEIAITPHHKIDLWTIQAGQTVPMHVHSSAEHVVIVMAGSGECRLGNQDFELKKGQMTIVPPGMPHRIRNANSDPLVLLTVAGPGPYDTRVLEREGGERLY